MVSIKAFSVTKGTALKGGGYLYSVLDYRALPAA